MGASLNSANVLFVPWSGGEDTVLLESVVRLMACSCSCRIVVRSMAGDLLNLWGESFAFGVNSPKTCLGSNLALEGVVGMVTVDYVCPGWFYWKC